MLVAVSREADEGWAAAGKTCKPPRPEPGLGGNG